MKTTITNGASSDYDSTAENVSQGNGSTDRLGPNSLIQRTEFVRLLGQALNALGYESTAKSLENESGIQVQTDMVQKFRQHILEGDWTRVVEAVEALPVGDPQVQKAALFLIYEQKYLEALENSDLSGALHTLRKQLRPLTENPKARQQRLHQLSSYLMCDSLADLMVEASWSGAGYGSRFNLLLELQNLLPPSIMLPERRLEVLVEQALQAQIRACRFHNTNDHSYSLLEDHICTIQQIPSITTQVLDDHTDEVWHLQFSHKGGYLASASKDHTAIVWEVHADGTLYHLHTLAAHTDSLAFVAWSPDDSKILTCGNDNMINLWDTVTGARLKLFSKHTDHVTACAWMPDGQRFVSGSLDRAMYLWDVQGNELHAWHGARINDLVITSDGRQLISTCSEKKIHLYNFEMEDETIISESSSITSLSISQDGRFLLVNLSCQAIHLWDLGHRDLLSYLQEDTLLHSADICKEYKLQTQSAKQGRFVIRSCFGGSEQSFIVSGSEDSRVYIWHLDGDLIEVLPGHSGTVNAVCWNPTNPYMFASASDDHTIRVWGTSALAATCNGTTPTDPADAGDALPEDAGPPEDAGAAPAPPPSSAHPPDSHPCLPPNGNVP